MKQEAYDIEHTAALQQAEDTENDAIPDDDYPSSLLKSLTIRDVAERTVFPDLAHIDVSVAVPVATVFQPADDELSVACVCDEREKGSVPKTELY